MTGRILDTAATEWMSRGQCTEADVARLFDPAAKAQELAAAEICDGCPVTDDCLAYALDQRIEHGVWGGKTEAQRRAIRAARRRGAA